MQKQANKNLLVCLTPLQMLIASKIIDQNPASYDVLCLSYNENKKYDYYFNNISKKCDLSWKFLVRSKSKIYRIFDFFRFKFFLLTLNRNKYNNVYLASIDNPFLHILLSKLSKNNIATFDDGTANIYKESIYYNYQNKGRVQDLILALLGNIYNTQDVVSESSKHYSIYNNYSNIIENVSFISLFNQKETVVEKEKEKEKEKVKIFLGQPFKDIKGINTEKILNFIESLKIDYYFPHPREVEKYNNFKYIDSSLIFEDYIVNILKDGYFVEVYTLLSTAALNVASLKNVRIKVLCEKDLNINYFQFYEIFKNIDCDVINF
ncbi:glycosyltransferase family 52 [Acinetobacter baumannii]|uniref:Gtr167 n=1 Tax=Acinetobacter baumannii TaxID=470 RepID=A0A510NCK1_ACIBA|nr:glycosyltransferase family 52 [Acinetobacter baumannii]DAC80124.1 TPA_exp: Gtr167 [Acinetobacter baumannii]